MVNSKSAVIWYESIEEGISSPAQNMLNSGSHSNSGSEINISVHNSGIHVNNDISSIVSLPSSMTRSAENTLLPRPYFLERLRLEKRRADRSKAPLSIALFHFTDSKKGGLNNIKEFLRSFQHNIRETDILGFIDKNVLALLLLDTSQEGTQEFLKKIVNGHKDPSFSIVTKTYPDQIFQDLLAENRNPPDINLLFIDTPAKSNRLGYPLKRNLDIAGSLVAIVLLSPLMLITALAIKATSPGPVIFKQIRLGTRGSPFIFYKFRSMYSNSDDKIHRDYVADLIQGKLSGINQGDKDKPYYKMKTDPRVTFVGKIIRKTSIDELPQLFNVLKGEMSLIGPRPPLTYEVDKYQSWHLRRILEMKPGITGLWQVDGRNEISFDDMVRLDIQYIKNCSLKLDLKILIKTVRILLRCHGGV